MKFPKLKKTWSANLKEERTESGRFMIKRETWYYTTRGSGKIAGQTKWLLHIDGEQVSQHATLDEAKRATSPTKREEK